MIHKLYFKPSINGNSEYKIQILVDDIVKIYGEGDELYSYIKVHDSNGISFYYIVICIGKLAAQLLPVLSFPTLDPGLYNAYKKGQLITGKLKN